MTSAEELAAVRARLERMIAMAEASKSLWHEGCWYNRYELEMDVGQHARADAAFIAAASPDLLLRLAREALGVLDLHPDIECQAHCAYPCPEVASVLRAWQP